MEENKTPHAVHDASPETEHRPDAPIPGSENRLLKKFPTMGDLFAMFGIMVCVQVLIGLVAGVALVIGGGREAINAQAQGWMLATVSLMAMSLSLFGILRLRSLRGGSGPIADFSARGLNPLVLLWAFAFVLAVGVVLEPLLVYLPTADDTSYGLGWGSFLALVIFAPVFEEVICRGVVLGSMRAKYGVVTAWLGSSLFFGLLHGYPALVVNAFVMGLILGYIYIATGSLWASIILHAANNAAGFALMALGQGDKTLHDLVPNTTLYVLIYIAAAAVAVVSGYMTWQAVKRLQGQEKNSAAA